MIRYLIWILTASLYAPVIFALYRSCWGASDYTHVYFIFPIFFWLVWRKRKTLSELIKNIKLGSNFFSLFILLFLLFGTSIFTFSWREGYTFLITLSLIPVLYGLINYLYRLDIAKVLSFPVFYLILLAPPPIGIVDNVTLPMRYGISIATEAISKLFNYPIAREGLLLSIVNSEVRLQRKTILISFVMPLSLFGNLIRIIALCLITYYFGEAVGQGFFHNFSGIVICIIILLGLVGLEHFLERYIPYAKIG